MEASEGIGAGEAGPAGDQAEVSLTEIFRTPPSMCLWTSAPPRHGCPHRHLCFFCFLSSAFQGLTKVFVPGRLPGYLCARPQASSRKTHSWQWLLFLISVTFVCCSYHFQWLFCVPSHATGWLEQKTTSARCLLVFLLLSPALLPKALVDTIHENLVVPIAKPM